MAAGKADTRRATRAYLSEPGDELTGRSERIARVDGYAADYQRAAQAEAARILADVEPTQRNHTFGPGYWTLHEMSASYNNTSPVRFAGEDLAESLSAALSAPDFGAYLAQQGGR